MALESQSPDRVLPSQTDEGGRDINGSALPNGGIMVLLDHHLAPADSLFTLKTATEHEVRESLTTNCRREKGDKDINRLQ